MGRADQPFADIHVHMNHWGFPSKPDLDSRGLGWALRVCISNQLPGDTGALVLGPHFE